MYYSIISKLDKGEAGMLGTAGDFPACQRGFKESWRKKDSNIENAFLRGPLDPNGAGYISLLHQNFSLSPSLKTAVQCLRCIFISQGWIFMQNSSQTKRSLPFFFLMWPKTGSELPPLLTRTMIFTFSYVFALTAIWAIFFWFFSHINTQNHTNAHILTFGLFWTRVTTFRHAVSNWIWCGVSDVERTFACF